MKYETRVFNSGPLTVEERSLENGTKQTVISGYAIVFDSDSLPLFEGGKRFIEQVDKGALTKTISENKSIRCLFNHDSDKVLGSTRSGTLKLMPDDKGLKIECTPPDTSWTRDCVESLRAGIMEGMSFGFQPIKETWEKPSKAGEFPKRMLKEIKLSEVSPVFQPAYPETSVNLRSYFEEHGKTDEQIKEIESLFVEERAEPTDEEKAKAEATRAAKEADEITSSNSLAERFVQFLPTKPALTEYRRIV